MQNFVLIEMIDKDSGKSFTLGIRTIELFYILVLQKLYELLQEEALGKAGVGGGARREIIPNPATGGFQIVIHMTLNTPLGKKETRNWKFAELYLRRMMLFDRDAQSGSDISPDFWKKIGDVNGLMPVDSSQI
jgi:hypothetical protein